MKSWRFTVLGDRDETFVRRHVSLHVSRDDRFKWQRTWSLIPYLDTALMEVPVIVVTTNAARHLDAWLKSVRRLRRDDCVPIPFIVDNGSIDRTPGIIWKAIEEGVLRRENVTWLHFNRWFVSAQNIAFRTLGAQGYRYVATLNEDATADERWLDELMKAAARTDSCVGMFCSLILRPDHRERISSAGHTLRRCDGAFLDVDYDQSRGNPTCYWKMADYEPFSPCFAAALWDLPMIGEVGLPDNDQLIYYDDVDLAYKARLAGWKCVFVPNAVAYHPLPRPPKDPARIRAQFRGRLAIIARYFPDDERDRLLGKEDREADSEWKRAVITEILQLPPNGSDKVRAMIFGDWADRHPARRPSCGS